MIEIENIGRMIERAIEKSRKLKEGILKAQWKDITGKLSEKSQVLYIKENMLYIVVESSSVLHFMEMNKKKYIDKVNEILNANIINNMSFRISKIKEEEIYNDVYTDNNNLSEEEVSEDKYLDIDLNEMNIFQKIEYLKKSAEKKEQRLLKAGYKKCPECGAYFKSPKDMCKVCQDKKGRG